MPFTRGAAIVSVALTACLQVPPRDVGGDGGAGGDGATAEDASGCTDQASFGFESEAGFDLDSIGVDCLVLTFAGRLRFDGLASPWACWARSTDRFDLGGDHVTLEASAMGNGMHATLDLVLGDERRYYARVSVDEVAFGYCLPPEPCMDDPDDYQGWLGADAIRFRHSEDALTLEIRRGGSWSFVGQSNDEQVSAADLQCAGIEIGSVEGAGTAEDLISFDSLTVAP